MGTAIEAFGRRAVIWGVVSGVAATASAVAGAYVLRDLTAWSPLATELLSIIPIMLWGLGVWLLVMRPALKSRAPLRRMMEQLALLSEDLRAAAEADDMNTARMIRARIIALLLQTHRSVRSPMLTAYVSEALADVWPDPKDMPTASDPAELLGQINQRLAQVVENSVAVGRIRQLVHDAIAAKQRAADAKTDYALSRAGGFDDPDKRVAAEAAEAGYDQAVTDVHFALITTAEAVYSQDRRLAAELADIYTQAADL